MQLRTRVIGAAIIVIAALSFTAACGSLRHPQTAGLSVEGQVAVAGRQLVAAITSAADGVDTLIETQLLPKPQGVAVLQVLRGIGVESQRLGEALDVINLTKDKTAERESSILKASEIIKGMQAAVLRGIIPGGTEASRTKLAALMAVISNALVQISLALPNGGTFGPEVEANLAVATVGVAMIEGRLVLAMEGAF